MVKSETRPDAEILVRNPSPRLFGKKFRDSKKVNTNHAKTRLRDLSKTLPRFRDPAKIFRDPRFSKYHSPPLKERGRSARKQIKPPLNSMTAAVSNGQTTSQALTEVANKPKQATFLCPSPLHHTFLLGRARFTAQPLSALVRTDRPDPSRRNENFAINQNYPARSVKS